MHRRGCAAGAGIAVFEPVVRHLLQLLLGAIQGKPVVVGLQIAELHADAFAAHAEEGAVIDVGTFLGMGGKSVGVKLSDLKTDNNRLTLDRTKEQLQQMANYRLKDRNTGAGSTTSPVHGGKLGSGR